jgi:endonuclease I
MRTVFLFLIIGLLNCEAYSQTFIEPCKFGQPLINAIQQNYTPAQTLGYNPGRDTLYSQIDNVGNDLFGIYTNFKVTLDPNQDPSVSAYQSGAGINAEHVYPQSKGAGNEPMRSDLHNIYPAKVNVNSSRGNCPFDDIDDFDTDKWFFEATSSTSIPSSNIDAYSEKDDGGCEFEPREAKKGDIARAVFYFYAIYQTQANNADPNFFDIQKNKLLEWHYQDLPDSIEIARNQAIASHQGNLNPFTVDTSLARRAFFMADASYNAGDPNCYDVLTNIEITNKKDEIILKSNLVSHELRFETELKNLKYQVITTNGQILQASQLNSSNTVDITSLSSGIYFIKIIGEEEQLTFKFFVQ